MKVLYATDGSGGAQAADRLLASWPLPSDTQVTVLSAVHHDPWIRSLALTDTAAHAHPESLERAQHHAEAGAALLRPGNWRIAPSIGGGDAAVAILREAEADEADLIVVGAHERHGIERVMVGSVSEHVARYARTSVLVARSEAVKRVIIAIDGSDASEHALGVLTRLPLPAGIGLTLVYVAPPRAREWPATWTPEWTGEPPSPTSAAETAGAAEKIFEHATRRLRALGRTADVAVYRGHAAEQILIAADNVGADLVVVGSANRSVLGRLIVGSVSGRVLGRATCSVLVARPAPVPAYVPNREPAGVSAAM